MLYGFLQYLLCLCRPALPFEPLCQKVIGLHVVRMICNNLSQAVYRLVEASIGEQDFAASEPCPGQFPLRKDVIVDFERVRQVPELEIQVAQGFH